MFRYLAPALAAPLVCFSSIVWAETELSRAITNGEGDLATGSEISVTLSDDLTTATLSIQGDLHTFFDPEDAPNPSGLDAVEALSPISFRQTAASQEERGNSSIAGLTVYPGPDAFRVVIRRLTGSCEFQSADPCPLAVGDA